MDFSIITFRKTTNITEIKMTTKEKQQSESPQVLPRGDSRPPAWKTKWRGSLQATEKAFILNQ